MFVKSNRKKKTKKKRTKKESKIKCSYCQKVLLERNLRNHIHTRHSHIKNDNNGRKYLIDENGLIKFID